jgi:hypothetical protein
MTFLLRGFALIFLALTVNSAMAQTPTLPAADESAIRAVLDRQIESWNHHDMKAYVADMLPDVEWINVVGIGGRVETRSTAPMKRTIKPSSRIATFTRGLW